MKSIKLFAITIFCMVLLVGTVSAFEFDNIKNYDEKTKTIDVRNSILGIPFLQLDRVATIRLETPREIVINNIYEPIARFDINNSQQYSKFLNKVETFKEIDDGDILDYNYRYEYFDKNIGIHSEERTKTNTYVNGTSYEENYLEEVNGSWLPFDETLDLPGGNLKMKMFFANNIPSNQIIEVIPTFFGVRVNEWFQVELKQFYDTGQNSQERIHNGAGWESATQTFTPLTAQNLIFVEVLIQGIGTEGTLHGVIVNTTDGTSATPPDESAVVATFTNVSDGTIGSSLAFFNLTFSDNNASLCANCTYGIWLRGTGVDNNNEYRWGDDTTSATYTFGKMWLQSTTRGSPWTEFSSADLQFRTYALIEAPPDDPPKINLINPADNQVFNTNVVTFSVVPRDGENLTNLNVSLYHNNTGTGDVWAINQTNATAFNNTATNFTVTFPFSSAKYIWNALVVDPIGQSAFNDSNRTVEIRIAAPIVTMSHPINNSNFLTIPSIIIVNATVSDDINISKVELYVDDVLNQTNQSQGVFNNSVFTFNVTLGAGTHTVFINATDSDDQSTSGETRFVNILSFFENVFFFNSSSFETKQETIIVNITTNGSTPANGELIYNGTTFTGVAVTSIAGNNFNLSRTINVLTGTGNKSFFFNFTLDNKELSTITNQQNISGTSFGLCNSTLTVPHLNFTFRNETLAQENVNGTISSTWVYSLGDLSGVTKSLIFSNATENANYTFCGTPDTIPFNIDVNLTYNNAISQQRSFSLTTVLTSVTTTQVLHLLPTALGIFSPFKTVTITGDPFTDVRAIITRILGGLPIDISSGFTDGSGFITFFLDPDETYTATFSKAGVADNSFSFFPTADLRTVIMGQQVSAITNGTTIARGLLYNITPVNGTLANNTNVNFTLFASSNETITLMSLNITNSTNTQLLFVNATSQGLISGILNTGNQTKLIGTYIIQTATETITIKKIYIIGIQFEGDYSIYRQFTLFTTYGFSDFIRILFVVFFISIILIFLTRREVIDTSESKVIVATLLIWAFSLVGWLDTGLVTSTSSTGINRLSQFSNQFGIAIISTGISLFFILRRVFIRRP